MSCSGRITKREFEEKLARWSLEVGDVDLRRILVLPRCPPSHDVHPTGAYINVETTVGHEFSYVVDDQRHFVVPSNVNSNGGQFVSCRFRAKSRNPT